MKYIAEDGPWYMVDTTVERPWRDEDVAMSAPVRIGEFDTLEEAQNALHDKLWEYSEHDFIVRSGESVKYQIAAAAILAGVNGIRIDGRYYRVREA